MWHLVAFLTFLLHAETPHKDSADAHQEDLSAQKPIDTKIQQSIDEWVASPSKTVREPASVGEIELKKDNQPQEPFVRP